MPRAFLAALLVLATIGCGKKGPPLLPFVRIPAAAEITAARRAGNEVYVTISVPSRNVDDSTPASIAEIRVYALTSEEPPPQGLGPFVAAATLVATIPVAREADPADRSGTVVPDPATGALQGTSVTISESLTPETLKPRAPVVPPTPKSAPAPAGTAAAAAPGPLRRFYLTVPYSARERSGSPSAIKEVPLTFLPDKVPAVRVAMSGRTITVEWEPSGGVLGWLLERPLPPEVPLAAPASAAPASSAPAPAPGSPAVAPSAPPASGTTLYNIYREISPDPLAPPRPAQPVRPWVKPLPTPVNPQPQPGLTFIEQDVPFDDRERCYDVRAVRGSGAQQVESEPSERRCVVSIDLEPPTAPTGLMATSVEGMGVFLRWDPNGEEDLRGYVVLRGEAGDDTLQTLTREPLAEPRYTDAGAVAGRTYRYVVRAVDTRIPLPNESDPTDVTVTAR